MGRVVTHEKCSQCKLRPAECSSADQVDDTIALLVKRFPMLAERRRVFICDLDELIGRNCKDIASDAGDQDGGDGAEYIAWLGDMPGKTADGQGDPWAGVDDDDPNRRAYYARQAERDLEGLGDGAWADG